MNPAQDSGILWHCALFVKHDFQLFKEFDLYFWKSWKKWIVESMFSILEYSRINECVDRRIIVTFSQIN